MVTIIRNAIMSLLSFTVLTGFLYPLVIAGIAETLFPHQANGSIIVKNGTAIGSALIGQQFDGPEYFWGRLSATSPYPYNGSSSSGSNLGPNNPDLMKAVRSRIETLRSMDPGSTAKVPVDLVTGSSSGLDPHISLAAAEYQVSRVAKTRRLDEAKVREVLKQNTEERLFGMIGQPVVNVLKLNLMLDGLR